MTPEEHQAALRQDSTAFVLAAAGSDADLGAPVPSCPEWKLRVLVHHLAVVHAFRRGTLEVGDVFLASMEPGADRDLGGTLLLQPGDVPGAAVRFVADGRAGEFGGTLAGPGASADCLLSGTASDLLLFLWGRLGADDR